RSRARSTTAATSNAVSPGYLNKILCPLRSFLCHPKRSQTASGLEGPREALRLRQPPPRMTRSGQRATFSRGGRAAVLLLLWIAISIATASGAQDKPGRDSAASVAELLEQLELPESSDNLQRRRDAARELSEIKPLPADAITPLATALDTEDRGGVQRY